MNNKSIAAGRTGKKAKKQYRSAITGKLVKKAVADASPDTTVSFLPKRSVKAK
jgi:hypothetical protein